MKKNTMIIFIIALLVVGGAAFALVSRSDDEKTTNTPTTEQTGQTSDDTPSADTEDNTDTNGEAVIAATIAYGDDGFSPASTTVKKGDTVKITNNSTGLLNFESDPHPTHTDNTELNVGEVEVGASKTFKVTKVGSWGFHNHENEEHGGTLIVQ